MPYLTTYKSSSSRANGASQGLPAHLLLPPRHYHHHTHHSVVAHMTTEASPYLLTGLSYCHRPPVCASCEDQRATNMLSHPSLPHPTKTSLVQAGSNPGCKVASTHVGWMDCTSAGTPPPQGRRQNYIYHIQQHTHSSAPASHLTRCAGGEAKQGKYGNPHGGPPKIDQ